MNKTSLITSATGIALALTSVAPLIASANDGGSVNVDASVSADARTNDSEHRSLLNFIPRFKGEASTTARVEKDDKGNHASSTQKRMDKGEEKAGDMIAKRIDSLTELKTRLANIKLLSAADLASLQASIDAEIQVLNDLKAKISADTSIEALKADAESITKANRVYLLVEPKARIAAAASRIKAVVTQMTTLGGKLQERITDAQTAGTDVSAAVTAMSDFNAKIADAKTQADAAVSLTANLTVDNGDKTVLQSNMTALKNARAKLQAAESDLKAARVDVKTIMSVVAGKSGS